MRKFLGAISTKTLTVVGLALIITGGVFFALNKTTSDPLTRVLMSIANIQTEFEKTSEDFTPGFGLAKINDKIYNDGIYTTEFNLNTNHFSSMGIDKAGIQLATSTIPKELRSEVDLNISVGNLAAANAKITSVGNILYANIPSLYEKTIKLNLQSLGEDLQSESIANLTGSDFSEIKDLSINVSAIPTTGSDFAKDYFNYVKPEFETLKANTVIEEKAETDAKLLQKLKDLGSTKTNLEQFNIAIKSEDLKSIILKSVEYYTNLQNRQISGVDLSHMTSQQDNISAEIESQFEYMNIAETVTMKTVLSKDNLVALSVNIAENIDMNIYFAGEKNTTDNILVEGIDGDITSELAKFEMKKEEESNVIHLFLSEGTVEYTVTYKPNDKTVSAILSTEPLTIDFSGQYTDIKEGIGYNLVIDDMKVSAYDDINFTGNIKLSTETPTIATPSESVELLKSSEEEITEILQTIATNAQTNYGPLMMMFYMGGGF